MSLLLCLCALGTSCVGCLDACVRGFAVAVSATHLACTEYRQAGERGRGCGRAWTRHFVAGHETPPAGVHKRTLIVDIPQPRKRSELSTSVKIFGIGHGVVGRALEWGTREGKGTLEG